MSCHSFLRQKIEAVRKEKVAVQKMVDNLKKQVYDSPSLLLQKSSLYQSCSLDGHKGNSKCPLYTFNFLINVLISSLGLIRGLFDLNRRQPQCCCNYLAYRLESTFGKFI